MRKLPLLVAAGVGYVLGTKAGRERYEQIRSQAQRFARDPRVQQKARQAADTVKEKAPLVKDKATDAASAAASKVGSSGSSESGSPSTESAFAEPTATTTTNPVGTTVTNPPQA
jgi:hypothetical protein